MDGLRIDIWCYIKGGIYVTVYSGDNLEYTKGDSFFVEVLCDEGFEDGDVLEFSISPSENLLT